MIVKLKLNSETKLNINIGNLSKLSDALANAGGDEYESGNVWQAILDLAFDEYNEIVPCAPFDYKKMAKYIEKKYGHFAIACVLLGKYNQQVTNGGHSQYVDNEYDVCHKMMLSALVKTKLNKLPFVSDIFSIAYSFSSWNEEKSDESYQIAYENGWESYFGKIVHDIVMSYNSDIVCVECELRNK